MPRYDLKEHNPPYLTQEEVDSLLAGTRVIVTWTGGNGPWEYEIYHSPYVLAPLAKTVFGHADVECGPLDLVCEKWPHRLTRVTLAPGAEMPSPEFRKQFAAWKDERYWPIRQLPSGEWMGVLKMQYTYGLCIGLDRTGYRTRYCYETWDQVVPAFLTWDGEGDPPGPWLKQKPEERYGPGLVERSLR